MTIRELYAGIKVYGNATALLFGSTIVINKHTVVLASNGNVMVDYNPVAKTTDDPFFIIDRIVDVTL